MKHKLLDLFLKGSDCRWHTLVLAENEIYIVLKHNSHYAYINRMDGSKTCTAFAVLFDKNTVEKEDLQKPINYLYKWENTKISFNIIQKYCKEQFNILFEKDYISEHLYEEIIKNEFLQEAQKLTSFDGIKL